MKENRFLIFGTGFIAENYVHHLYESSDEKLIIKILFNKHKLSPEYNDVEHVSMNSAHMPLFLDNYCPNYVLCVHGNSFVPTGVNVRSSMTDNTLKTMEFLEKIFRSNCKKYLKKILVIGSASEYGKFYHQPIREDFSLHATSLYGLSKICLYNASMYYSDQGLPVVHVRQFNTIGPRQRDCFVLPSFCKQVIGIEQGNRDPRINVGDLTQERDFIDIRDTSKVYSLLFKKGNKGETYNVSSGKCVTIKELFDLVVNNSHINYDIKTITNKNLLHTENRLSKKLHADISKIKNLGFDVKYSLRQTVLDTLDYWRENV